MIKENSENGEGMLSYESFFLIILLSIIGPVFGLIALIFYNMLERQVYLLKVENRQISLEKELETSRYMQLNQQIQPHFLFNALNSIYGLIRLKRYDSLSQSFEHLVLYIRSKYQDRDTLFPFEKEIAHTQYFLELQKLRFGDRLYVKWFVEGNLDKAIIIPYLLQTLVENAFKHGIEMIEEEAVIEITIQKSGEGFICLTVRDNGPGFQEDPFSSAQQGIGLNNIKKRLNLLFGDKAQIIIGLGKGACISVIWPLVNEEVSDVESFAVR